MNLPSDYLETSKQQPTRQRYSVFIYKFRYSEDVAWDCVDAMAVGVSRASFYRYWQYLHETGGLEVGGGNSIVASMIDGKRMIVWER